MAQAFPEKAHLRTDMKKYGDEYERIFGKKDSSKSEEISPVKVVTLSIAQWEELTKDIDPKSNAFETVFNLKQKIFG